MRLEADTEERLDRFLARLMPEHSRTKLVRAIQEGHVRVDGKKEKPSFRLEPGMGVEVAKVPESAPQDLTPYKLDLDVPYEDEHMLVVNKPRGLATHPAPSLRAPSLVNALLARSHKLSTGSASYRPGIVHRLDKETTGVIAVAKTDAAHRELARQIEEKTAERRYLAIVAGDVEQERFIVEAPLARSSKNRLMMTVDPGGKHAVTHVTRLRQLDVGWLLDISLETGRTHQIRVHLSAVKHPVLGDPLYAPIEMRKCSLQLHAAMLAFDHPVSGERLEVRAGLPYDFLDQDAELGEA